MDVTFPEFQDASDCDGKESFPAANDDAAVLAEEI